MATQRTDRFMCGCPTSTLHKKVAFSLVASGERTSVADGHWLLKLQNPLSGRLGCQELVRLFWNGKLHLFFAFPLLTPFISGSFGQLSGSP